MKKFTKELLENSIIGCNSLTELAIKLNVVNITHLKKALIREGVTAYFIKTDDNIRPRLHARNVRKLLNDKKYHCAMCHISDWLGEKITLDVDHIDGDRTNNKVENLQYLCPNCHRIKSHKDRCSKHIFCSCGIRIKKENSKCKKCFDEIQEQKRLMLGIKKGDKKNCKCNKCGINIRRNKNLKCQKCFLEYINKFNRFSKLNKLNLNEWQSLLWKKPIKFIAKDFGVSDSAICKFIKSRKLSKPKKGYWLSKEYKSIMEEIRLDEGSVLKIDAV